MNVRKTDVELLERLSDAAMRSGHTQTAIEGYALCLRLRMDLTGATEPPDTTQDGWLERAVREGLA